MTTHLIGHPFKEAKLDATVDATYSIGYVCVYVLFALCQWWNQWLLIKINFFLKHFQSDCDKLRKCTPFKLLPGLTQALVTVKEDNAP